MKRSKVLVFLFFVLIFSIVSYGATGGRGGEAKSMGTSSKSTKEVGEETKKLNIRLEEYTNYFVSPLVADDYILFIVTNKAKKVEIIGDFTHWEKRRMVYEEKLKLWYYVWAENLPMGEYRYRLIMDDIFVLDPLNPATKPDGRGGFYSLLKLDKDFEVFKSNPRKVGKDLYEFVYKDLKASRVILVGSFNNWNPYQYEMTRYKGGIWKITIRLPKGTHYYYFIVDDEITPDPLNYNTVHDKFGNALNVFEAN
jgi:1,4-alpha-glucan branching enzyme